MRIINDQQWSSMSYESFNHCVVQGLLIRFLWDEIGHLSDGNQSGSKKHLDQMDFHRVNPASLPCNFKTHPIQMPGIKRPSMVNN